MNTPLHDAVRRPTIAPRVGNRWQMPVLCEPSMSSHRHEFIHLCHVWKIASFTGESRKTSVACEAAAVGCVMCRKSLR